MRYLIILATTFLLSLIGYIGLIPLIGPTPVSGEYWIKEMLTIKRNIVKHHGREKKIIIASGSSTLFSIDTTLLTREFGVPVINLGLMGGMPLDRVLREASLATQAGDVVILALEPDYYCREEISGFDEWVFRNAIAWDHEYWDSLPTIKKWTAIWYLGFRFPLELITAQVDKRFRPEIIAARLFALNEEAVLNKYFDGSNKSDQHLYSVYTMDSLGNIKNTADSSYEGNPRSPAHKIKVCPRSLDSLTSFVAQQTNKNVRVYFVNTPYVANDRVQTDAIVEESAHFKTQISSIAPVLDNRLDVVFDRSLFLNSDMHLNTYGRDLRTRLLLPYLRDILPVSP
jgi:hypothetical protein